MAEGVLQSLVSIKEKYDFTLRYIDSQNSIYNPASRYADKMGIEQFPEMNKKVLTSYFLGISSKCLIVSAGNYYIFPADVIDKQNITIINYHNSLLPKYPGMNAASWAIYMGEKITGITWHYVSKEIDRAPIIIQEECYIEKDEKAYQLMRKQMILAINGFKSCIDSVLREESNSFSQLENKERILRSRDIPQDGKFDVMQTPEEIYRLLRACDCGMNSKEYAVTFTYNDSLKRVVRYGVSSCMTDGDDSHLCMRMTDGCYLVIKYTDVDMEVAQ